MVLDMTTDGNTGLTGSDTSAWSGKLSSGSLRPARASTTLVCPAATMPTRTARDWPPQAPKPPDPAARIAHEAQDLAVLDDIDAHGIGGARIAPGDSVVARHPATPLQSRADHGIAQAGRDVERRADRLGLRRGQPLVVDAVEPVGVDVALEAAHIMLIVRQHKHAALGEHDVVVELTRQAFPKFERVLVDGGTFRLKVVGADDRGVAPSIAAADPALLEDRRIAQAMLLGKVVGGGEAMSAAADDHGGVCRFGRWRTPLADGMVMAGDCAGKECAEREAMHAHLSDLCGTLTHCACEAAVGHGLTARVD